MPRQRRLLNKSHNRIQLVETDWRVFKVPSKHQFLITIIESTIYKCTSERAKNITAHRMQISWYATLSAQIHASRIIRICVHRCSSCSCHSTWQLHEILVLRIDILSARRISCSLYHPRQGFVFWQFAYSLARCNKLNWIEIDALFFIFPIKLDVGASRYCDALVLIVDFAFLIWKSRKLPFKNIIHSLRNMYPTSSI